MTIARPVRELLFACAVWGAESAELERVRAASCADIDWDEWLRLVRWHRLVPHAARALAESGAVVPPDVSGALGRESLQIAARALRRTRQLLELLAALRGAGVEALPFKGPTLSLDAYGDVGVRDSIDLDVVVRPRDVDAARAAMAGSGYVSRTRMTPAQERMLQRSFGHFSYERDRDDAHVELHWRYAAARYPWSLTAEEVFERSRTAEIAGSTVRLPDATDRLLLQAMHGARHQWERIEWLVTFSQFIARERVDEAALLERASARGSLRALRVALRVSRELLGATRPLGLEPDADDPAVAPIAAEIVRAIESGTVTTDEPYALDMRMMDRPGDRARYLASSVIVPTLREWELVQLPDALLPLYYPIRLLRVLVLRLRTLFVRR